MDFAKYPDLVAEFNQRENEEKNLQSDREFASKWRVFWGVGPQRILHLLMLNSGQRFDHCQLHAILGYAPSTCAQYLTKSFRMKKGILGKQRHGFYIEAGKRKPAADTIRKNKEMNEELRTYIEEEYERMMSHLCC